MVELICKEILLFIYVVMRLGPAPPGQGALTLFILVNLIDDCAGCHSEGRISNDGNDRELCKENEG